MWVCPAVLCQLAWGVGPEPKLQFWEPHEALEDGLDREFKFDQASMNFKDICNHVLSLRPVHRCKAQTFASILNAHHLFSMVKLRDGEVTTRILENKFIQWGLSSDEKAHAMEYVEDYLKKNRPLSTTEWAWFAWYVGDSRLKKIEKVYRAFEEWHGTLQKDLPGIGFGGDQVMGLDDTVFSIFGPHNTEYYGQVQLIFGHDVMQHPSSYFLPCAGTYFNNNGGQKFSGVQGIGPIVNRTWARSITRTKSEMESMGDLERRENFVRNMWHCSVPDWWKVVAKELIARTAQWQKASVNSIRWKDILDFNEACEGHAWLEAHLPRELPLEYVTDIVLPNELPSDGEDSGSMQEMEMMGWTAEKIKETLGPDIRLHTRKDKSGAKAAAKEICCSDRPVYNAGFMFNTSKTMTRWKNHPPTGLILPNPQAGPVFFSFKASAGVSFNLVLATDPVKVSEGVIDDSRTSSDHAETKTIVVHFVDTGAVLITASYCPKTGKPVKEMKTSPDFNCFQTIFPGDDDGSKFSPDFLNFGVELSQDGLQICHCGASGFFMSKDPIKVLLPFKLREEVYVGCSAESEENPVCIVDLQVLKSKPADVRESFKKLSEQPQGQLKANLLPTPPEAAPLPLCIEAQGLGLPLEMCPLRDDPEHKLSLRHLCRWGKSCTKLQPSRKDFLEHHKQFCHKDLETCKHGGKCKKLSDPVHRAQFHHEGLADWISLCRQDCTRVGDGEHLKNYLHGKGTDAEKLVNVLM